MATQIFLSNDASDISGYLLAYIGTRSPNASSTVSTAVTTAAAGVATAGMTLTVAGAVAAKWITRGISAAVTVAGTIGVNIWQLQSLKANFTNVDIQLQQYVASTAALVAGQAAFMTTSINLGAETAAARTGIFSKAPTSTAFAVGDRIVILPNVNSVGARPGTGTTTMDYNGKTENADGDTWIQLDENVQTTTAQGSILPGGRSNAAMEDLRFNIAALQGFTGQVYSPDAKVSSVLNELGAQRDLQGA